MQYTPKPATATTSPKFDPLGFVWVHSFSDISIKIESLFSRQSDVEYMLRSLDPRGSSLIRVMIDHR